MSQTGDHEPTPEAPVADTPAGDGTVNVNDPQGDVTVNTGGQPEPGQGPAGEGGESE